MKVADPRNLSRLLLGCALVLSTAVRLRLLDMPLERDEGEYAYGGQLLLNGFWPPGHLYTMKLPGTHAAYALLMGFFGQSCGGVHLGLLVVNCLTILLVFQLARQLTSRAGASLAAAVYAVLSLSPDTLGTAAHATHFVVLFAVGGLMLLGRAAQRGSVRSYLGAGLLLSVSVLMKHNGLFFLAFGAAWMVAGLWSAEAKPTAGRLKCLGSFALGALVPFLLLLVLLCATGTLRTQWFWSVTYAGAYSQPNPGPTLLWRMFLQRMPPVLELPLAAALPVLALLWFKRTARPAALFLTGLFVFSALAVVPGFHFRPHYYVLLLPVLALLAGVAVQLVTDWLKPALGARAAWAPGLLMLSLLAAGMWKEREFLFQLSPEEACRRLYGSELFAQARVLGAWLREHSPADARLAVLGSEPEVFFYARRLSATGFVYTYPLTERQPFAEGMRRQIKEEVAKAQPLYVVQVRPWTSWQPRPASPGRIAELCQALTPPEYEVIGDCKFNPQGSGALWDWYPHSPKTIAAEGADLVVMKAGATPASGE